jgi:predicted AAA+ superfamily ATPase
MKRNIIQALKSWKDYEGRKPLLLRGARQTGKTFAAQQFGAEEFQNTIYVNLERNPELKDIFRTLVPAEIVERITLYTNRKPEPGKTLLIIDEIQESTQAILSLRYFYEEMPGLHVIAAGSLLEFALKSENLRMPVGRVQYLYMYPMSFGEFLDALGETALRNYLLKIENLSDLPESLHLKLLEMVRKYYFIGGMPEVVQAYISTGDIKRCQRIQRSILDTYIDDFGKYAKASKHEMLRKVFNAVSVMVGQKFVYSQIDRAVKAEKLFLDVGLMHALCGIYSETARENDFTAIFKGAVAEQFVGQELLVNQSVYTKPGLYYWGRNARNSMAEIDYLIEKNGEIVPVEVKSGAVGRMKSLHLFMEAYKTKRALKISQAPFEAGSPVLSLPFYAIEGFLKQEDEW